MLDTEDLAKLECVCDLMKRIGQFWFREPEIKRDSASSELQT
jgi:hypothetical protein